MAARVPSAGKHLEIYFALVRRHVLRRTRPLRHVIVTCGANMRILIYVVAIAAMLSSVGVASAQTFPSRPMTMVVPFPAGGGTDIIARALAERMRVSLGR